jgi:hypothetical protein
MGMGNQMFKKLIGLFGGSVWSYIIACAVVAAVSVSTTYSIMDNVRDAQVAKLEKQILQIQRDSAKAALTQLTTFISRMANADKSYRAALEEIANRYGNAAKDFENAASKIPLDPKCKPTADRMRAITAAIAAANKSTAPTQ